MNDNYDIYGKYGCWWEGGTGVSPDGRQCGECYPNYEDKCPFLEKYRRGEYCPDCEDKQIEEMAKLMVDSDNKEVADTLSLLFVRLAEALYNAGYRKQKWISVEDRLPKEDTIVLVWCGEVSVYNYLRNDVWYTGYCHITTSESGVTHWMPLPEAPEMKGSAE